MTKQEDYPAQTAALIEQAFTNLARGLTEDHGSAVRDNFLEEARAQLAAAQTIAVLGSAHEAQIANFLAAGSAAPADGSSINPEITRAAYEAALIALGLVDAPEEGGRDLDELRRDLGIDTDLGDLG